MDSSSKKYKNSGKKELLEYFLVIKTKVKTRVRYDVNDK